MGCHFLLQGIEPWSSALRADALPSEPQGISSLIAAAAAKSLQSCLTLQPQRWQPTRLTLPWDSPGKNTGVECHFLLQCLKVKSESEVAQSCLTLRDPMDYSLPDSSSMGFSKQEYWSGLPLPSPLMQGTRVQSLIRELDPTCHN